MFFYHGLELEPWVDGTVSQDDMPPSYMTHTMPTGEITLDYRTMLVNDLCEQLSEGDKQSNDLLSHEGDASQLEIHLGKEFKLYVCLKQIIVMMVMTTVGRSR